MNSLKPVFEEEVILEWTQEEKNIIPLRYGCQIILENTTIEQAKDKSFPNDAYLIWYQVEDKNYIDLCRGTRANIFDLYYDKFGPGSIKKIDFGYGRANPKLWGYKKTERKKRK